MMSSPESSISTPKALKAVSVLIGSSALRKFFIQLFPFAREEKMRDLWDIDLSGVGENVPRKLFALLSSILSNTFPQCPGLLEIFFEGLRIIGPEILADPFEIIFEYLERFKEIVLIEETYITP